MEPLSLAAAAVVLLAPCLQQAGGVLADRAGQVIADAALPQAVASPIGSCPRGGGHRRRALPSSKLEPFAARCQRRRPRRPCPPSPFLSS